MSKREAMPPMDEEEKDTSLGFFYIPVRITAIYYEKVEGSSLWSVGEKLGKRTSSDAEKIIYDGRFEAVELEEAETLGVLKELPKGAKKL